MLKGSLNIVLVLKIKLLDFTAMENYIVTNFLFWFSHMMIKQILTSFPE